MSPVKYELGFYIPEDDILHSDRHENLKSYIGLSVGYKTDKSRDRSSSETMPSASQVPSHAHVIRRSKQINRHYVTEATDSDV
jgi:hypothetical protein